MRCLYACRELPGWAQLYWNYGQPVPLNCLKINRAASVEGMSLLNANNELPCKVMQRFLHDFAMPGQSCRAWKVLQASTLPESMPRLNQRTRCAEVPWVKESGTT
jgi:hypothetical protein